MTVHGRKIYLGTYQSIEKASNTYDVFSILMHWGKGKTNQSHNKATVLNIAQYSEKSLPNNFEYPDQI